jgi:hypothetical protein
MFEKLNFAKIKENIDEMTYNMREKRNNLHSMMAELLAEV